VSLATSLHHVNDIVCITKKSLVMELLLTILLAFSTPIGPSPTEGYGDLFSKDRGTSPTEGYGDLFTKDKGASPTEGYGDLF